MPRYNLLIPKLDHVFKELSEILSEHHPNAPEALSKLYQEWVNRYIPRSLETYASEACRWTDWLRKNPSSCSPLSAACLRSYMGTFEEPRLKPRTIERYLTICHRVLLAVCPDETAAVQLLKDIRTSMIRRTIHAGREAHQMALLTRDRLQALSQVGDPLSVRDTRTLAIAWVLYDTMLPPGRIFGEQIGPAWVTPPLRTSALTPHGDGARLTVAATLDEKAEIRKVGPEATTWLRRYHQLRGPHEMMFSNRIRTALHSQCWSIDIVHLLHDAGLGDLRVGLQSCRRGAAHDMLRQGVNAHEVCRRACWNTIAPILRLTAVVTPTGLRKDDGAPRASFDVRALRSIQRGHKLRVYRKWHCPSGLVPHTGDLFEGLAEDC